MPHKIEVSTKLLVSPDTFQRIAGLPQNFDGIGNTSDISVIAYLDLDPSIPDGMLVDKVRRTEIDAEDFIEVLRIGVVAVRNVPASPAVIVVSKERSDKLRQMMEERFPHVAELHRRVESSRAGVPLVKSDVSILRSGIDAPPDGVARVYPTISADRVYFWQRKKEGNYFYELVIIDRHGIGSKTFGRYILSGSGDLLASSFGPRGDEAVNNLLMQNSVSHPTYAYLCVIHGSEEHAALLEWIKGEGKPK